MLHLFFSTREGRRRWSELPHQAVTIKPIQSRVICMHLLTRRRTLNLSLSLGIAGTQVTWLWGWRLPFLGCCWAGWSRVETFPPGLDRRPELEEEEEAGEVLGPWGRTVEDIEGGLEGGQESCEGSSHLLSWNLLNEIIPWKVLKATILLHTHRAGSRSSCSLKGTPAVPCPQSAPTISLLCPSPRSNSAKLVP